MKTTGSIRCEIISEVVDTDLYQVSVKDERHMSVLFCVPKSAVTDVLEEVDWSKVKHDTLVVWWYAGEGHNPAYYGRVGFYRGRDKTGSHLVAQSRFLPGIPVQAIMLFTDWLKEHGGQDE